MAQFNIEYRDGYLDGYYGEPILLPEDNPDQYLAGYLCGESRKGRDEYLLGKEDNGNPNLWLNSAAYNDGARG